jgi:hypothetical protein
VVAYQEWLISMELVGQNITSSLKKVQGVSLVNKRGKNQGTTPICCNIRHDHLNNKVVVILSC